MNSNNKKIEDMIIFFYMSPLFMELSIIIFLEGEIAHISGHIMVGDQAKLFALIIFIISSYIIYAVLYKIPLQNHGIGYVKIIFGKLLHSPFLYIFIITITMPIILKFILSSYLWLIAVIILLLICFIAQWNFMKEIRKYIE